MQRVATALLDLHLLTHALARFELAHHGYPFVATPPDMAPDLVPTYLTRVPEKDPWGRPYVYKAHKVLVRRHPKAKARLTDSYEMSAGVIDPGSGHLVPLRLFNGTFVEAPQALLPGLLTLRDYPRYPGPSADVRAALRMFRLARPLELVKLVALRIMEDTGGREAAPHLAAFLRFNEPDVLQERARDMLERFRA